MITEKITSGQRKQLVRVLEDAVDALGLTKDQVDEILKVGNLVQADLKVSLNKHSIADKRYGPAIKEFEIIVPLDYNHDTQVDVFAKKVKKEKTTYYFNNDLTSKHFANASTKLVPGKTYKVKIFPILKRVTSEDNMAFLAKQNAIFVGDHGLTLVCEQKKEELPKGKYTVSFDKKESLWKDTDGNHRVPNVYANSGGGFRFDLGYFEHGWVDSSCLLCFCDLPVSEQA